MWSTLLSRPLLLGCFVLLQGVDFLLTWFLVGSGARRDVYEANPLALAMLARTGWAGLAAYKAVFTVIAGGAVLLLWQRRVEAAQRLGTVLCLAMLTVVVYSGYLAARPTDPEAAAIPALRARGSVIANQIDHLQRFINRRTEICRDLLEGKATHDEAIARLREAIDAASATLAAKYRMQIPDGDHTSELASYLYHYTCRLVVVGEASDGRLARLRKSMRAAYPGVRFISGYKSDGRANAWRPRTVAVAGHPAI